MEKAKMLFVKYWQPGLIIVLALALAFVLGYKSNSGTKNNSSAKASPMCKADPIKFEKIEKDGLTVTYTYNLPKNFNSGIDYGDGTHSKYKANVGSGATLAQDTYTYSRPGTYLVGLYTYDYDLACDNGVATYITVP